MPQNRSFAPSCNCRDDVTVRVMRPAVESGASPGAAAANTTRSGVAKFARSNRLNTSNRSCSWPPPPSAPIFVFLTNDTFVRAYLGPLRLLRPALPNVPGAGSTKADVSNQRSGWPTMRSSGLTPGRRFGRSSPDVLPDRDQFVAPSAGVNGTPVRIVRMPFNCHPPSQADVSRPGRSQTKLDEKTWRTSKSDRAQSRSRSYGSCGYTDELLTSAFNCACMLSIALASV